MNIHLKQEVILWYYKLCLNKLKKVWISYLLRCYFPLIYEDYSKTSLLTQLVCFKKSLVQINLIRPSRITEILIEGVQRWPGFLVTFLFKNVFLIFLGHLIEYRVREEFQYQFYRSQKTWSCPSSNNWSYCFLNHYRMYRNSPKWIH